MPYSFNPHLHVKVWVSSNPSVFMNFENQTRLIAIREKNPRDVIHLVYDSSMLNEQGRQELDIFCKENNIIPVDAVAFKDKLESPLEQELYEFYKDEITHLKEGGNLGVASDILRWLSPSYRLGSYTDLDVQLDTNSLPEMVEVDSPLLLNIGGLGIGKREMVIALNEFISVPDEVAAKVKIQKVQAGILKKLKSYDTDYIKQTNAAFAKDGFFIRTLLSYMENRSESAYIQKTNSILQNSEKTTSRKLRGYIKEIMSDKGKYLQYNKLTLEETDEITIQRLREKFQGQLGLIKWLFFRSEYNQIKKALAQTDDKFINYLMKKELSLYIKSIVICTTGPVEVANSLFDGYVMRRNEVNLKARPLAFSHYDLHHAFLSKNVIPFHQNVLGMLGYLGSDVGELNDSSWLEEGVNLIAKRQEKLMAYRKELEAKLPSILSTMKIDIEDHIKKLQKDSNGWFGFVGKARRDAKITALQSVLGCYTQKGQSFDIEQFKKALEIIKLNKKVVYAGIFSNHTKELVEDLEKLCHETLVLRLAKDKKLQVASIQASASQNAESKVMVTATNSNQDRNVATNSEASICYPGLFSEIKSKKDNSKNISPIAKMARG